MRFENGYRSIRRITATAALVLCMTMACGCDRPAPTPTPEQMTPIKVGPGDVHTGSLAPDGSRAHVKFRKNKDGTYSWDITGDDVDSILEADRKLREGTGGVSAKKSR